MQEGMKGFIGEHGYVDVDVGSVDVHRKRLVGNRREMEVRRYVRCGCVNVDLNAPPRNWPKFSQGQVTRCVCESGFVVEKLGGMRGRAVVS